MAKTTTTTFFHALLLATCFWLPIQARSGSPPDTRVRSTWMIQSIMSRNQGVVSSGAVTSVLEAGILSLALESWLQRYSDSPLSSTVSSYLEQVLAHVDSAFTDAAAAAKLPLDRLAVGQALQELPPNTLSTSQSHALTTLNASLAIQKRNHESGLWYYVYRDWSYIDGAVSFLPFMANNGWSRKDMRTQIVLLWRHCYHGNSGLLVHGYDYEQKAVWANQATGASPYVWGRALGWYVAGLVNTYEALQQPVAHGFNDDDEDDEDVDIAAAVAAMSTDTAGSSNEKDKETKLEAAIRLQMSTLASSIVRAADSNTGAWWQLPTEPGHPGNFLESSATALFVFALIKAVRLGLAPVSVLKPANRAWDYTWQAFVIRNANDTLSWNGTVASCSLNSTASYEYYTTRPIVPNSLLGEAAFVLAALEVEKGLPAT